MQAEVHPSAQALLPAIPLVENGRDIKFWSGCWLLCRMLSELAPHLKLPKGLPIKGLFLRVLKSLPKIKVATTG